MRDATTILGKSQPVADVGRKLRDLRKARSLTQTDLAARIGVQQSDLCRMENGQYRVTLETLVKILTELEVSFSEFFQEEPAGELTLGEASLLRTYRQLPGESQEAIQRFMRFVRKESNPGAERGH